MTRTTVLVVDNPATPPVQFLERLPDQAAVVVGHTPEALRAGAPGAEVILSWFAELPVLEQAWRLAPGVRWVHSMSAGLEHVIFPGLVESRAVLTNARGVFSDSLGEFVVAAALYFAKDFPAMRRNQAARSWVPLFVEDVRGRTLGIVGYGDIGRAIARRARALEMQILAVRRHPELSQGDPLVDAAFPPARLRDMLGRCDFVAVATPLTEETRGLIAEPELRAMPKHAVLVNVGRGPVVHEPSLIRALGEGWIRGAALDVFETEPLPREHPFWGMDNVLVSPHSADRNRDWLERAAMLFVDNFERYVRGDPLRNVVDKQQGY